MKIETVKTVTSVIPFGLMLSSCDKKNARLVNGRHTTPEKIEEIKEAQRAKAREEEAERERAKRNGGDEVVNGSDAGTGTVGCGQKSISVLPHPSLLPTENEQTLTFSSRYLAPPSVSMLLGDGELVSSNSTSSSPSSLSSSSSGPSSDIAFSSSSSIKFENVIYAGKVY
ncbi:hypothetical protein AGMMS49990_00700 [Endomicrobiia bacterium]|nr:hypothetical protein AGMMS49990_00700 [Endomicrobiia bacterium]